MKRSVFQALAPICPACRQSHNRQIPLRLHAALDVQGDEVEQGFLLCAACQREYPIIDGIPILVSDVRTYIASSLTHIHWRDDLPDALNSLIGDCCGPNSSYDLTRHYLSTYAWGHYHDLDPHSDDNAPPALVNALHRAMDMAGAIPAGPVLDAGCSVGRSTFALAEALGVPVLGIDVNFSMLRMARRVARGEVVYPLRLGGLRYTTRRFAAQLPGASAVDFWAADATNLPFPDDRFAATSSFNLLDCVPSPYDHLSEVGRVTAAGGRAWIGCPYDWSPAATDPTAWIGGHSERNNTSGESAGMLRRLLTPGSLPHSLHRFEILAEQEDVGWIVRLHERSRMRYALHLVVAAIRANAVMTDADG